MSKVKKPASSAKELPFEESIKRLETIVGQLEEGEIPLEKSLELFEDGVRLSRDCLKRLDAAERRIEVLMKDQATGEEQAVPFEPSEDD